MDPAKLVLFLVVGLVCFAASFAVKDKKGYLLFLIALFLPFRSGLIFYHYNGIILIDFPLFLLFILSLGGESRFRWSFPLIGTPLIVFIIWSFLASITAINIGWAINQWTRFFRAYLLFLVIVNNVNSFSRLKYFLNGFLAGFAFQALLGVYQWRYGPAGLWILEEVGFPWRASGTFIHPAMFADYLAFFLPVLLRLFAFYPQKEVTKNLFYGGWFVLGLGALFGTYARGVWLGFFVAIFFMVLYSVIHRKLKPRVKIAFVILSFLALVFVTHYADTISSQFENKGRQRAAEVRIPLNKLALRMIAANPILGVGPDNYRLASPKYVVYDETTVGYSYFELTQIVHNSYLLLASELGIPGLLFFLWFIGTIFFVGKKNLNSRHPLISNLSIGLLVGIVANLIEYLAGPDLLDYQITTLIASGTALIYVLFRFNVAIEKKIKIEKIKLMESKI